MVDARVEALIGRQRHELALHLVEHLGARHRPAGIAAAGDERADAGNAHGLRAGARRLQHHRRAGERAAAGGVELDVGERRSGVVAAAGDEDTAVRERHGDGVEACGDGIADGGSEEVRRREIDRRGRARLLEVERTGAAARDDSAGRVEAVERDHGVRTVTPEMET